VSQSINNLNQGSPSTASQIPFYDPSCGQDRKCSVSDLAKLVANAAAALVTQYASPNVSGYTVTVQPPQGGQSVWLVLTPVADYANLTLVLPIGADKQEVQVSTTHAVSSVLTVNGATVGAGQQPVNGAPTTLTAGGLFRLRFDGVTGSWYRV
jgi:hypothetical protein